MTFCFSFIWNKWVGKENIAFKRWIQALDMCTFNLFCMPTVHFIDLLKALVTACLSVHTRHCKRNLKRQKTKKNPLRNIVNASIHCVGEEKRVLHAVTESKCPFARKQLHTDATKYNMLFVDQCKNNKARTAPDVYLICAASTLHTLV